MCIYTQYISIYENINVLIQKLFLRDFSKNQPKLQCGNFALINWYSLQKETDNVSLLMHNSLSISYKHILHLNGKDGGNANSQPIR